MNQKSNFSKHHHFYAVASFCRTESDLQQEGSVASLRLILQIYVVSDLAEVDSFYLSQLCFVISTDKPVYLYISDYTISPLLQRHKLNEPNGCLEQLEDLIREEKKKLRQVDGQRRNEWREEVEEEMEGGWCL